MSTQTSISIYLSQIVIALRRRTIKSYWPETGRAGQIVPSRTWAANNRESYQVLPCENIIKDSRVPRTNPVEHDRRPQSCLSSWGNDPIAVNGNLITRTINALLSAHARCIRPRTLERFSICDFRIAIRVVHNTCWPCS